MDAFVVEVDPTDPNVLTVSGELDIAVADEFLDKARGALSTATATLVIDVDKVTFIDSTGLGALVRLREEALEHGKTIQLARVPRQVGRVLDVTGLSEMFPDSSDG